MKLATWHTTCPECGTPSQPIESVGYGLDVKDITTPDDEELGLVRFALRCQGCGYATAFVGRPVYNKL